LTVAGTAVISGTLTAAAGSAAAPTITATGDTNTGIFFPAADTIAFTEGGAEAMRIDSSANLQFNSGYGSVAIAYGCRAWVNFNGAGALTGTYSQSAFAITVSVTSHGLIQGQTVNITFQTGTASQEAFTVTSVTNANQFVVTSVTSRTTSGNCTLATIIRASGNVSSVTDNGTGDYTVNFTTSMPDANYSTVGLTVGQASQVARQACIAPSGSLTGSVQILTGSTADGSLIELNTVCVSVFR